MTCATSWALIGAASRLSAPGHNPAIMTARILRQPVSVPPRCRRDDAAEGPEDEVQVGVGGVLTDTALLHGLRQQLEQDPPILVPQNCGLIVVPHARQTSAVRRQDGTAAVEHLLQPLALRCGKGLFGQGRAGSP